jgi:hypothetical protein
MALSAAFDVLGGVGTICAAFFPEKYPPLWPMVEYKWIYQIFVFVTLGLGIIGVWITIALIKDGRNAYKNALILLLIGVVFGGVRVFTSLAIRGKAAPTNVNWYLHIFTLIVFLLFVFPGLKKWIGFSSPDDTGSKGIGASMASIISGVMLATSLMWLAPSHTYQGENWADLLRLPVTLIGSILILGGMAGIIGIVLRRYLPEIKEDVRRFYIRL